MSEQRLRRLEAFTPEGGDPPCSVFVLDGRWVKILWHPDDVEQARSVGVNVDALDRVELPDGRVFPFQGFGPDDTQPPPLPGSKLAQLDEAIRRRSEPRSVVRVEVEVPVVPAQVAPPSAPVQDDDEEGDSWTL